jgi:hypothetical protein
MRIHTLMAVLLAASVGTVLTACQQRSDTEGAQPRSRVDSPTKQGMAPGAPTQGSAQQSDSAAFGKDSSSTAAAPGQLPERGNAMASPSDERGKANDTANSKSPS